VFVNLYTSIFNRDGFHGIGLLPDEESGKLFDDLVESQFFFLQANLSSRPEDSSIDPFRAFVVPATKITPTDPITAGSKSQHK